MFIPDILHGLTKVHRHGRVIRSKPLRYRLMLWFTAAPPPPRKKVYIYGIGKRLLALLIQLKGSYFISSSLEFALRKCRWEWSAFGKMRACGDAGVTTGKIRGKSAGVAVFSRFMSLIQLQQHLPATVRPLRRLDCRWVKCGWSPVLLPRILPVVTPAAHSIAGPHFTHSQNDPTH